MPVINRVRIVNVAKGSHGEKAELQKNDIILTYNGVIIDSAKTLENEINNADKNKDITMRIRRSKHLLTSTVTTEHLGINFRDVELDINDRKAAMETIKSCYDVPKKICHIMYIIGWLISGVGVLTFLFGALNFSIAALTGISLLISGLIIVMVSAVSIAVLDNSDINRESFLLNRSNNERQ
jgi:hypothetical protein